MVVVGGFENHPQGQGWQFAEQGQGPVAASERIGIDRASCAEPGEKYAVRLVSAFEPVA